MKLDIQLFASGTISRNYAPSNGDIQIVWSSIPSGSAENYSTVTASVQVKRRTSGSTTGTFSGYIYIDGQAKAVSKKFSPLQNSWKTVGTFETTVNHNADGTKQIWIESDLEQTGTSLAGDYNANQLVTLDTILRPSPVSTSSSVNMGSSVTINTNRYSSSFTHTIRYVFGSASGTIASNVGASTTWTPPLTLANQIPNTTSETCTIYCDTYNGSTLIGTTSATITLNVPSSVVPTISVTNEDVGDTPSSWGIWLQKKSKIKLTATASGVYGSTIVSYKTTGDGISYNGNPITSNYLNNTGNVSFVTTVTDSRGRTANYTTTINVYPYNNPTILTAQIQRCDENGNIDSNGEYMYISYGGSISSCNGHNTSEYKVGYRVHNTGDYQYVPLTTNVVSYSVSGMLYTDGIYAADRGSGTKVQFSSSNNHDIQFYVGDYFTNYTNVLILDTGFDLMNFNASGKSMALGMVSQRNSNEKCLDIALDTYIGGARIGRIARVQLTSNSETMELTNLGLEQGRTYKIIVAEYATSSSNDWHLLEIENDTSNKSNVIFSRRENSMQTTAMSVTGSVGVTNYVYIGTNVMFSEFIMNYYDSNNIHLIGKSSGGKISSGTVMIEQVGSLTEKNIQTINTIGVYGNSSRLIGSGSYMEIWG